MCQDSTDNCCFKWNESLRVRSEKHYIICGPEFGLENVGKTAIIVRALYGGKSAGADYWRHVRAAMTNMNFISCKADPDVWM